jgi:hypothetical protein
MTFYSLIGLCMQDQRFLQCILLFQMFVSESSFDKSLVNHTIRFPRTVSTFQEDHIFSVVSDLDD